MFPSCFQSRPICHDLASLNVLAAVANCLIRRCPTLVAQSRLPLLISWSLVRV
jgi:hypothetical protein